VLVERVILLTDSFVKSVSETPPQPRPIFDEGIEQLIESAKHGDADAMYQVALFYYHGTETEILLRFGQAFYKKKTGGQDYGYAFEWLADAADQGHVESAYWAGVMIQERNGIDVFASVKEAKKYLKLAAKAGNFNASARLRRPIPQPTPKPVLRPGEIGLDSANFKRLRRPWLLIALLPSFLLDLVILGIGIHDYYTDIALGDLVFFTIIALVANAVFLKGGPYKYYRRLYEYRQLDRVRLLEKSLVYQRHDLHREITEVDTISHYREYRIKQVETLVQKKDGSIHLAGTIEVTRYHEWLSTKKRVAVSATEKVRQLIIPGYYQGMSQIHDKLSSLR
jgi:hypothetical protein